MAAAVAPTVAQEDEFYAKILALRDAALAGTHPKFKLPADAIEQLKASLIFPDTSSRTASQPSASNGVGIAQVNGSHIDTNTAPRPNSHYPAFPGLSYNSAASTNGKAKVFTSTGLDPIFLEKSDSLVRAEGQLKRQRIERDLLDQAEKSHKHGRDKEMLVEAPSTINIDAALAAAQGRIAHVSGLKLAHRPTGRARSPVSSFDENDYYSSKAGSAWSAASSPGRQPDGGSSAFTADHERLESHGGIAKPSVKALGKRPAYDRDNAASAAALSSHQPEVYNAEPDGMDEADDEDEEYSPPDPTAFDSFREEDTAADLQDTGADEDDSEYEPGELTQEALPSSLQQQQPSAYSGPQGPIIRNNHLTHIAAPQPNRVSPLAMQKRPNLELELVNGCPVVKQPEPTQRQPQPKQKGVKRKMPTRSRASSGSPTGTQLSKRQRAVPQLSKKELQKQEKQEKHLLRREKLKKKKALREARQAAQSPPSPRYPEPYSTQVEPYIKPEPVSPQPFSSVPVAQPYGYGYPPQPGPIEIDDSPQHAHQPRYVYPTAPRREYMAPQAPSPTVVRMQSPGGYRPVQRDTQDLRRVASLHHASRPTSPQQQTYSPVIHYPRQVSIAPPTREYAYREEASVHRYAPVEAQPEPLRLQEYRETSPAMMPLPSAAPRRIVVDQYGNRYYAAESAPNPRASVAPAARAPEMETPYDRAPSRMSVAYVQQPPAPRYEHAEMRMPPPPPPTRRQAPQEAPSAEYVDTSGHRVREYSTRPVDAGRYSVAPTSPVYQQAPQYVSMAPPPPRRAPQYEPMPPPPGPQESTSPVYAPQQPPPRAYSVRPESYDPNYAPRQASVAPVQYAPPAAPPSMRAASVAPRAEYGAPAYQERAPSYAPQPAVRYVDEYGREVVPREVRQASGYGY